MISVYTVMMKHSLHNSLILHSVEPSQQLNELCIRIRASFEPPISEIRQALENYLSAGALPVGDTLNLSAQDERAVHAALAACAMIVQCKTHLERHTRLDPCFLKAWPGIWSWLQFFDQCYQRDKYGGSLGLEALLMISGTLQIMLLSKAVRNRLTSTPGVITLIVGHWKEEGHNPSVDRVFRMAGMARPFTTALDGLLIQDDWIWAPVIIMASGGAEAAAINAIKHLNDVLGEKPLDLETISLHISLIRNFCRSTELNFAMLNQGMVISIVKTLSWLETQPTRVADVKNMICACTHLSFLTLNQGMMTTASVIQALEADILPVILKSARRLAHDTSLTCSSLLSNTLCLFLVFKSVVRSAAKALKRVDRLKLGDSSGGPIWKAWVVFKTLCRERIDVLDNMDQGERRMQRCQKVCLYFCHYVLDLMPSDPCAVC